VDSVGELRQILEDSKEGAILHPQSRALLFIPSSGINFGGKEASVGISHESEVEKYMMMMKCFFFYGYMLMQYRQQ
jgi:hypothetical protein